MLKNHAGNHERRELLGPILNYYKVLENLKSWLVILCLLLSWFQGKFYEKVIYRQLGKLGTKIPDSVVTLIAYYFESWASHSDNIKYYIKIGK